MSYHYVEDCLLNTSDRCVGTVYGPLLTIYRFFKSLFGRCLKGLLKTCFSQTDGLVFCLCPTNMSIIPSQDLPISYEQKNDILDMFCFCCIDSTIQPRLICILSILSSRGYTFHRFENHALFYVS